MRFKFLFLAFLFLLVLPFDMSAQSSSDYRISWNPDPSGKTVSWNLYIEEQPTGTGFTLADGVSRANTDLTPYEMAGFQNLPVATIEIIVNWQNNGVFTVIGVEGVDGLGTWSDVGANLTPYRKGDAPPKPDGITIEKLN